MDRYRWNLLGLCEVRWKNFGETITEEGHKLYYSDEENKHEYGVGFLNHKNIMKSVMGCRPISSRLISIRLRVDPFKITVIQVYAPKTDYSYDQIEEFYSQLQRIIDQAPKKDILIVQGDWNAKVGKDTQENWQDICGRFCNATTNERCLNLLEFATYNKLGLANTYGPHKASRRWTWHSPNGQHHNQIDYILLKQRFRSGINIAKTRSFPGADIGSDHDLVMVNFRLRLKRIVKPKQVRMTFALEKLKDPNIGEAFQATIGGKFAPLTIPEEENTDIETLTNKFNNAMTDTASVILGKHRHKKKPWVTTELLGMCDKRRVLKRGKKCPGETDKYREINKEIRRGMTEAKEKWREKQCSEDNVNKYNRAFQFVKDLTSEKKGRINTIQDKSGKCLMEEREIINRWTEYCTELYNSQTKGNAAVLDQHRRQDNNKFTLCRCYRWFSRG